jgi:hypothetical protein
MGSPLSPTLANIIMIALEDEIIKDLFENETIKFYIRYVEDTLVLAKPSDINLILNKLNSYHPDIQFTHEEFVDNNEVTFLDIKLTSNGTSIFRKSTHTGQCIHLLVSLRGRTKLCGLGHLCIELTKFVATKV